MDYITINPCHLVNGWVLCVIMQIFHRTQCVLSSALDSPPGHKQTIALIMNSSQLRLCTITASLALLSHTETKKNETLHEHLYIYARQMSWESQTIHITKHIQGLLTGLLAGIMAFKHSLQGWVNMLQWKTTFCTQIQELEHVCVLRLTQ